MIPEIQGEGTAVSDIFALSKSSIINILHINTCGSIFCGHNWQPGANKSFESNILWEIDQKKALADPLAIILFSILYSQNIENKGLHPRFPANPMILKIEKGSGTCEKGHSHLGTTWPEKKFLRPTHRQRFDKVRRKRGAPLPPRARSHRNCHHSTDSLQRVLQIGDQIVGVLDSHRQPHHLLGDSHFRALLGRDHRVRG